jgi:uncharacterized repeat protein (TIGR01451 family)
MLFRRLALGSLCVVTAAGMVIAADNQNPFAQWDRLKQKTGVTESRSLSSERSGGSSLEYFSPSAVAKPAAEQAPATERRRLKLIETSATSSPASATAATSTPVNKPAVTEDKWPAGFTSQKSATPAAQASPATVTQAGGDVSLEAFADSAIKQVKAEIRNAPAAEEPNPFADFLATEEATEASAPAAPAAASPAAFTAAAPADTTQRSMSHGAATTVNGPQSPTVTLQWVQQGEFNVGQECRCDLVIENTGQYTVRNVIADAIIPPALQVVTSKPMPASAGEAASWSFAELKPGDVRKVELTVIPHGRGDLRMDASVRFTGYSASVFSVQEPMLAVDVNGPEQIEVGQQVGYVVEVRNPGTGMARNVRIQAAIPEGLEHRRGSLLTIEIGTLNPGESRQARLSLTAVEGGSHSLAVRTLADGGLSHESTSVVSVAEPMLKIALQGPEDRLAGQPADYELVITNDGKVPSNNVRAKYKVPTGYEFVHADRGGKFISEEQTIDWFVGTLDAGETSHFHVTLRPIVPGPDTHRAGVISEHGKVTMAEHSTTVQGSAKLKLEVVAKQQQMAIGQEALFEVTIRNTGSRSADSVGLSCELPAGLELIDAAGPSEYIAENGVMVFRSMPALEADSTAVFTIKARCVREGAHSLRVRAASESVREPLIGEESVSVSR